MLTFDLELSHGPNSQPASTITPSNTSASSRTLRTHPDTLRLQTERQELELFKPSRFISRYNVLQLPFGPQVRDVFQRELNYNSKKEMFYSCKF